jgi:MatE
VVKNWTAAPRLRQYAFGRSQRQHSCTREMNRGCRSIFKARYNEQNPCNIPGHARRRWQAACQATKQPSTRQRSLDAAILALALPALGIELIDPLLSVCDTAFVGRVSAEQLAGVGIASSVFAYTYLFFNFLSTATAPLIAGALAKGDEAGARGTASNALTLALALGAACCVLLEVNAEWAVAAVSGTPVEQLSGASAVAVSYLRCAARLRILPYTGARSSCHCDFAAS